MKKYKVQYSKSAIQLQLYTILSADSVSFWLKVYNFKKNKKTNNIYN